jgi:hypothetical protein
MSWSFWCRLLEALRVGVMVGMVGTGVVLVLLRGPVILGLLKDAPTHVHTHS